jgi:hypothetical protein
MRTLILVVLSIAMSGVLAGGQAGPAQPLPASSNQATEPPVVCGFRNTAYAGLCEERAPYVKDKKLELICKPILDCLNDIRCIKTYCGSTTVRQGWTLESAKRDK